MTIGCDKTNPRRRWKVLGGLLVVLLLLGLLSPTFFFWTPLFWPFMNASGAIRDYLRPPQWETVLSAELPDNSLVEYRQMRIGSGARDFSLRWQSAYGGSI